MIMKRQLPRATSAFVRKPAAWAWFWRSTPMTAPRRSATQSRNSTVGKEIMKSSPVVVTTFDETRYVIRHDESHNVLLVIYYSSIYSIGIRVKLSVEQE